MPIEIGGAAKTRHKPQILSFNKRLILLFVKKTYWLAFVSTASHLTLQIEVVVGGCVEHFQLGLQHLPVGGPAKIMR